MKKRALAFLVLAITILVISCGQTNNSAKYESTAPKLTNEQANRLAKLPLKCLSQEFPNKPGETIINAEELRSPKISHPAFYGCFDWHSSVHGHWVLVKLLNDFPDLENREEIETKIIQSLSLENIKEETAYLSKKHEAAFERTYGWAWFLKLVQEINQSKSPKIKDLEKNLQPLTDLIVKRYIEFLPKLNYPLRVGTHTNTAFGLTFADDYAKAVGNQDLQKSIEENARRLFIKDEGCPLNWEPSGNDFLSPCFEEMNLMRRVLPKGEFFDWNHKFLPPLENKDFDLEVGKVSDRSDGYLVHLDGLNFSRAWIFYGLAKQYPEKYGHLVKLADKHLNYSLPTIVDGNYEGEHWLGSFALYALSESQ